MYVTVRSYAGNRALVDALLENESEVKRIVGAIDGFKTYYLIRTIEGDAMSISVFADKGGGDESSRRAAEWVRENLPDLSVGAPQVSEGEVVITF